MASNSLVPEKKPLRRMFKQAAWHPESGLITHPYSQCLPSEVVLDHTSTKPDDYLKPRFLGDENIYLAFYPTKPIHRSHLFSDLSISNDDIRSSILEDTSPHGDTRYILAAGLREKLKRLENSLLDVADTLLTGHKHFLHFPQLKFPRWPSTFGYDDFHRSKELTFSCAKRSIAAFSMLVAVTSFTLCLWLGEHEDDCFDDAFHLLSTRKRDKLPRVWLEYLKDTIVCSMTPGLRPGGFVDPYTTQWGAQFERFGHAFVPIWMVWGHEKTYKSTKTLDRNMLRYLPPSDEYIENVKKRRATFADLVLPLESTYRFEGETSPRQGPAIFWPPSATASWPPPSFEPPREDYNVGLDFVDFNTTDTSNPGNGASAGAAAIDRAQIVPPGSRQLPGESWDQFRVRSERLLNRRIENENPKDKQTRLAQLKASETGPTKKSKVFIWEQDELLPSFYRRISVRSYDVNFEWHECTKFQRFYWSHWNEWDLLPHLPLHPDGVPRSEIEEPDPFDDEPTFLSAAYPSAGNVSKLRKVSEDEVAPMMLQTVRSLTARGDGPASGTYDFLALPLLDYLRRRHGFSADQQASWHPQLHENPNHRLQEDKWAQAFTVLLYSSDSPLPSSWIRTAIVDFHNMALGSQLDYTDLPSSWDISPRLDVSRRLVCDMRRIRLQRVTSDLSPSATLYILRPPSGSRDRSPWFIATTSATTVLLVYRSPWNTMYEIGRGLLGLGIPFRTVVEKQRTAEPIKRPWKYKMKGLGKRPKDFTPMEEDFLAYEHARDEVLRSACGRAIRLQGGIAGRIASAVVPDVVVLDGPVGGNEEVVGHHGDVNFVDDKAEADDLDIVCGVYVVEKTKSGTITAHASWWPKQATWPFTGLAGDQWLPKAEMWYKARLSEIHSKKAKLRNATNWKDTLRYNRSADALIYGTSERWAAAFLSQDQGVC